MRAKKHISSSIGNVLTYVSLEIWSKFLFFMSFAVFMAAEQLKFT